MSPEQISANRQNAIALTRAALGLSGVAPTEWTYEQRTAYNKALAQYIADHPDQFAETDATIAGRVLVAQPGELQDASFDWSMFADEVVTNAASAAEDVAGVGRGVLNTVSNLSWLLPTVVIGGGLLLAWRYVNEVKLPGTTGKAKR